MALKRPKTSQGKNGRNNKKLGAAMAMKSKKSKKQEQTKRGENVERTVSLPDVLRNVPPKQRAGYPLVPTKVKPEDWQSLDRWTGKPDGTRVLVDLGRTYWLPDDWGQGVRIKKGADATARDCSNAVFVSPDGRVIDKKSRVDKYIGRVLTWRDGVNGQMRKAQLPMARSCHGNLQEQMTDDNSLLQLLSAKERKVLPSADALHFCVVSARRTNTHEGVQGICTVEALIRRAGVQTTWYVDKESIDEYRKLGLKAVVGGKLIPARNMALDDAAKKRKACVQVSDDVSQWKYHHGPKAESGTDAALNAAWAAAEVFRPLSPVAAARFLLAKLRAAEPDTDGRRPQLAGVYPLKCCARAFAKDEFGTNMFIVGDFFVVDKSPIRFDTQMTLKEDYAFTCEHIEKHGRVIRAQRMTMRTLHQTNAGGACSIRDKQGKEEQRNIAILMRRWPRAIRLNPSRRNEVVLQWPKDGNGAVAQETQSGKKQVRRDPGAAAKKSKPGIKGVRKDVIKAKKSKPGIKAK